ncbi:MAG: leucine-rich repeat domain-containing protein [Acidobacteriota bacterium]
MTSSAEARAREAIETAVRNGRVELDLHGLGLHTVPELPPELDNLRSLRLSGNNLEALPARLEKLTALEHLDLSDNLFTILPDAVLALPALVSLNVARNRLEKLPDFGGHLATLETLDLSGNRLSALPISIGALRHLRRLNLSANRLVSIAELASLTTLEELLIEDNLLREVPAWLDRLHARKSRAMPGPFSIGSQRGTGTLRGARADAAQERERTTAPAAHRERVAAIAEARAEQEIERVAKQAPAAARAGTRDAPPLPAAAEPVDAAVFCPASVARTHVFLVQVFLYRPGAEAEVDAQAAGADSTATRRGTYSLPLELPPGTRVDLHLEAPALTVAEPDTVIVWRGRSTAAQFEVAVPADAAGPNVVARVRFAIAGVPAGTLRFQVTLADAAVAPATPAFQPAQGVRYRHAFVSYSSIDRAEVLRRVQAFKIAGIEVFQDVLDLEPGERWATALYREIDRCDVFLLFWSRAAAKSEWVAKEIDYALARKSGDDTRPPDIQPVPIEGPPVVPPPPSLSHLHFNDALLAHIRAASEPPPLT